jgi:hypothetical protein
MRVFTPGFWNEERVPRELLENKKTQKNQITNKIQKNYIKENPQKNYKKENVQENQEWKEVSNLPPGWKMRNDPNLPPGWKSDQNSKHPQVKSGFDKSKYRGKGNKNQRNNTFSIFLTNLRGLKSKEYSLRKIIKKMKPSMILMNETQLTGRMKANLNPFTTWTKNRSEEAGGGVATAISPQFKDTTVGAGEGKFDDEYLITRVAYFSPALNVVNCYGEQRKLKTTEVEVKWSRMKEEMENVRARNEFCLLAGDLNKLVGCDSLGIPGNHPELSFGGKLLRELLATKNWFLVNGMGEEIVQGGPFTRLDPATGKLSALDLFIVSKELKPYVEKLTIDSSRKIAVSRKVKQKKGFKLVYSDHFSNLLILKNLPLAKDQVEVKEVKWNLAKMDGWKKYEEISEKYSKKLQNVVENENIVDQKSMDEATNQFEKIHDKIKFEAFGKAKIKGNHNKGGSNIPPGWKMKTDSNLPSDWRDNKDPNVHPGWKMKEDSNFPPGCKMNTCLNLPSGWKRKEDSNLPPEWKMKTKNDPNLPLGWKLDTKKVAWEEEMISEEINEIKRMKKSKAGKVWEIRKKVIGGKKQPTEATAVINPKTGKLAVTKEEIKSATLEYCIETLANNKPEKEHEDKMKLKKIQVQDLLLQTDGIFKADFGTFGFVVKKFKKSRKRNYDFLTKAGKSFQAVVFKFCQKMIELEIFPSNFQQTTLHMIFKGGLKNRRELLPDNRFIHSKLFFPRITEALIVEDGLKGPLLEGSSIYQIGGQPGHRSEELIFVMKSIVALYLKLGLIIIIQCWDVSKFFDKETLEDAILTCYKRNVDPKACRLWYKLNENTEIKVRTGVGLTKSAKVGAVLGQGTIGGALVSQGNIDEAVSEHFQPGGRDELLYSSVPLQPFMFLDDLIHGSRGLEEARLSSQKMNLALKSRGLTLNKEKSATIFMGSKPQRRRIQEILENNPIMCGEVEMKVKSVDKWLGQQLSCHGLADSVRKTIEARIPKIKGACLEIVKIVNDWRSRVVGGMETAILLWEACCIPSLLHGAGTWVEIPADSEKTLNQLQMWFLRLVLQVGPGAPHASLAWDSGCLDMELRVKKEKVMMALHLRDLEEQSLAKRIYEEQVSLDHPGLAKETVLICDELGIENTNITRLSKKDYRSLVSAACEGKDEERLRDKATGKSTRINNESYGKKDYFEKKLMHDVRQTYRTRFRLQPFAGNYSHDRRFAASQWLCQCQESREDESHLLSGKCPIYGEIRKQYGALENDDDLVEFFNAVLEKRDTLEEQQKEQKQQK